MKRFDASALYAALDRRRQAEGLSWQQLGRVVGVSPATMTRMRAGGRLEVDGMLAMVAWLGRPVEDFVRDRPE